MKIINIFTFGFIVIFLVILAIILPTFYESTKVQNSPVEYDNYQRLVYSVVPEHPGEYSIYMPIPELNGSIPSILYQLEIVDGNGTIEIAKLEGRTALKLTSSCTIVLRGELTLNCDSKCRTQEYRHYNWSTDPKMEERSDHIEILGQSGSNQSDNMSVKIFFNSRSNYGTSYAGYRTCKFEGVIKPDGDWTTVKGSDRAFLL